MIDKINMLKTHMVLVFCLLFSMLSMPTYGQETIYDPEQSTARNWNEVLLFAIRHDYARPTVHARNLFHSSALMYDIWSVYDENASPVFLGESTGLEVCTLNSQQKQQLVNNASNRTQDIEIAIAYGMYRLLTHRFSNSPGAVQSQTEFVELADFYAVDRDLTSTDFSQNGAASLGNYVANCLIEFGLTDGSNESNAYANTVYEPVNLPLEPTVPGNSLLTDSNRWQPLKLDVFIDQAGNETDTPPFLGAEWGQVTPFALTEGDLQIRQRDGVDYWVYHDPGAPAYLTDDAVSSLDYQWGHSLVSLWSAHLDPADGVLLDISPASIGNTTELPEVTQQLPEFYAAIEGGSTDRGHSINPSTNAPYETQMVLRGDYTRVLAEFWADGPDSETPPGHWFTILNELVSDHAEFERRYKGQGDELSKLEWDLKAYMVLGGALHDSAISAWGIKGWYDYIRPISAIRHMAEFGQSSNPNLANYHVKGLPLVDGKIELISESDLLAGDSFEHVGKIKLYAWKGPSEIVDPKVDVAGVGWILAENWWPYQRPSFVTPPFAGYVSGHSTFSRAAAEVLTLLTGNEFFPGGMGEYVAKKNEFLVFEQGPSTDIKLQWATYNDASDQTSLSRIWGGIHPPVDDVAGRKIGIRIASDSFTLAEQYFAGSINALPEVAPSVPDPQPQPQPQVPTDQGGGGAFQWMLLLLFAGFTHRVILNIRCI
jgi:hypothetical protein